MRCDGRKPCLAVPFSADARPATRFDAATGHLQSSTIWNSTTSPKAGTGTPERLRRAMITTTYKYLALGSMDEARGSYPANDLTGAHQDYPVQWRYDYFFAFDNPYAFYPRNTDDASGFAATVEVSAADAERLAGGDLRMALRGHLRMIACPRARPSGKRCRHSHAISR